MTPDPDDFTDAQFAAINRGLERHRDYSDETFEAAEDASMSARYVKHGRSNMNNIITVWGNAR